MVGSGGDMWSSTRSVRWAVPVKSASSRVRSETDPATSAATIGGSARTTGICETPYSCRIATASAIVSPGWVCTRSGSRPALPRSTSPTVCSRTSAAGGEAVLRQPVVVEDLGQVAAAGVGQQYDDHGVVALGRAGQLLGDLPCGVRRHPGRPADQHRLLAGEAAGEGERVGVGDLDHPVDDRRGRRSRARSPRRRPRRGRAGRCHRSRPSRPGRRRSPGRRGSASFR